MSTMTRTTLGAALIEASAFQLLFAGSDTRWEFAGSVRRRKPDVGDIEHVVMAEWERTQVGLFADDASSHQATSVLRRRVDELLASGQLQLHRYSDGRTRNGDRYMGLEFRGRLHEIFVADEQNWGCILAIRTGPADYSKQLVTRLRDRGYRQHEGYLYRVHLTPLTRGWIEFDDGTFGEQVMCPEERDYITRRAGLPWLQPEARQ